ncbi:MAG: TlpA disulfide reductase family protein [Ignavibacteria bacterium]|jgi:thiol-disulfide isomerase/thioredoxin
MKIVRILFFALLIFCPVTIGYSPTGEQNKKQIEVRELSVNELKEIIKNRDGKYLIINVWATWCIPCRDEFPDLIKFSNKHSEKVDIVGISVDYPDEIESRIIPFLSELKPGFINYVYGESDPERFINSLNSDWSGALPASFFYDSEGEQISFHEGKLSYEEFESEILIMND